MPLLAVALLLAAPRPTSLHDGCGTSGWRCGDTCISSSMIQGIFPPTCKCANSRVSVLQPTYCCTPSPCIKGGSKVFPIVSCPNGSVLPLTEPCLAAQPSPHCDIDGEHCQTMTPPFCNHYPAERTRNLYYARSHIPVNCEDKVSATVVSSGLHRVFSAVQSKLERHNSPAGPLCSRASLQGQLQHWLLR